MMLRFRFVCRILWRLVYVVTPRIPCEIPAYEDCATRLMRMQTLPLVRILLRPVKDLTIYLFKRFRVGFHTVKVKRSPTGSPAGPDVLPRLLTIGRDTAVSAAHPSPLLPFVT